MLRIHSSYHKCLTMYFMGIMDAVFNKYRRHSPGYRHFEAIEGVFYNQVHKYKVVSTNGFAIDLGKFDQDFRITRFIRDPRDLIVSGYHYHKKGAEAWFRFKDPTPKYWSPINGNVPKGMPKGLSYSEYLNSLSEEEGLMAEMEFRKFHLESMRLWKPDPRIRLYKYENILGNEIALFTDLFDFLELSWVEKRYGLRVAKKTTAKKRKGSKHIRNPEPGQWRTFFSQEVKKQFDDQYRDLIDRYGY